LKALLACALAIGACLALAGAVFAAPTTKNPNVNVLPVSCNGLGSFDALTMDSSGVAFTPNGVLVAKRISGEFTFSITTFDGQVFTSPPETFDEGSRGRGFGGRLIECTFTENFSETFTLEAEDAEAFGIPDEYVGTEVTGQGGGTGTAWVIDPGN
jgi:hypothetical protein